MNNKRVVRVDWRQAWTKEKHFMPVPPRHPLEETVRQCWIIHGGMKYSLTEILSEKKSRQREMMQRLRLEFRALGERLIRLSQEIEK